MKKIIISLTCLFSISVFANKSIGTCQINNSKNTASFYLEMYDQNSYLSFKIIDNNGSEIENDPFVSLKRQSLDFFKKGMQINGSKIIFKERVSYYKAYFKYNSKNKSAVFHHNYSCIRDHLFAPCETYVENFTVKFNKCDLDFTELLP